MRVGPDSLKGGRFGILLPIEPVSREAPKKTAMALMTPAITICLTGSLAVIFGTSSCDIYSLHASHVQSLASIRAKWTASIKPAAIKPTTAASPSAG